MTDNCLLIVEEDTAFAQTVAARLRQLGYVVVPLATTGEEAIGMAEMYRPDLVLMTIHLSGPMDGIDAAGIIKEKFGIPVLYVTTNMDNAIIQRAKTTEPVGYLVKPFGMQELATMLELQLYRRKMERSLKASEERYKRITESVSDYIYTVRARDGAVISTEHGKACVGVTGYSASEFESDPYLWWRMVHEEDREAVVRHAERIIRDHDSRIIEHRLVRKDGAIRWVRNTPVLSFDVHGAINGYDGVIRDITERKNADEEREQLIASLQKALAEVKTLGGLIPICSSCKKIRDDKGYWNLLEKYLGEHSDATVSHGICPECERQLYPQLYDEQGKRKGRKRPGGRS